MADHILDDTTRTKLALLCGFSQDSRYSFTPTMYDAMGIAKELQPVFVLRPYTTEEKSARRKQAIDAKSDITKVKAVDVFTFVEKIIISWENLIDPGTGKEIKFEKGAISKISDLCLNQILDTADRISGLSMAESLGFGY